MSDTFESPAKRRRLYSPRRDMLRVSDVQLIANNILQHVPKQTAPYYDDKEIRNFLKLLSLSQQEQLQNYMNEKFENRLEIIRSSLGRRAPGLQAHEVLGASTILTSCSYLLGLPVDANPDAAEIVKVLDRRGITPRQCRQSAPWIRLLGVEIRMPAENNDGSQVAQFQNWFQEEKEAKRIAVTPKKSCFYIDPKADTGVFVTKSETISLWALVTCLKYNVPLEALLRNWWTLVDMARRVYDAELRAGKTYAEGIAAVWKAIQSDTKYCYNKDSVNFLYDLYMYGKCQCSCGVIALREIMLQVDIFLKPYMWYAISQDHIMLGVQNAAGDIKYLETTKDKDNILHSKPPEFENYFSPTSIFNSNLSDIMRETRHMVSKPDAKPQWIEVNWLQRIKIFAKMGAMIENAVNPYQWLAQDAILKITHQDPASTYFYEFLQLCNQFIYGKVDTAFCDQLYKKYGQIKSYGETWEIQGFESLPKAGFLHMTNLIAEMYNHACIKKPMIRRKWIEDSETPTSDFRKMLLDQ